MIITCEKCSKTFNIQDKLVPEKGRLLQCGNCNHKWFFIPIKKEIKKKIILKNLLLKKTFQLQIKILKTKLKMKLNKIIY